MKKIEIANRVKAFVLESNSIEDIHAKPGSPEFDNHEQAVYEVLYWVREKEWVRPIDLHSILMKDIEGFPQEYRGKYRDLNVTVGGSSTPKHETVPHLMHVWVKAGQHFSSDRRRYSLEFDRKMANCFRVHYWFECIHPFADGNGRVGRLMWLYMWLLCDLPWVSFGRYAYYNSIREWRTDSWPRVKNESLSRGKAEV